MPGFCTFPTFAEYLGADDAKRLLLLQVRSMGVPELPVLAVADLGEAERATVDALAAAAGSLASTLAFYPLDTAKTRLQACGDEAAGAGSAASSSSSLASELVRLAARPGEAYAGAQPQLLRAALPPSRDRALGPLLVVCVASTVTGAARG